LIVLSHIEVGNYFFRKISVKKEVSFRLIWGAFIFSNIFPDFSKFAFRKHSYEATRGVYKCYLKKARNPRNSELGRSMALGVVCHFICDYFCKYHGKKPFNEKSLMPHLYYETILHIKILEVLFKINTGLLGEDEQSALSIATYRIRKESDFDLQAMFKDYEGEMESMLTDVTFAFSAVREAMKEILDAEKSVSAEGNGEGILTGRITA